LNDAYKEIVILRPDANAESATVSLAAGARQKCHDSTSVNLPTLLRVLDVVRNMHSSSDKRAIRRTDRKILDDQRPTWYTDTPTFSVQHFIYDDRNPHEFMVYPPANAGTLVEIVYSSVPSPHNLSESELVSSTETIRVDDIYANCILDYVLYRAYSKDAEYAANGARAQAHYAAFSGTLGAKTTVDSTVSPNATSPATPRG
jgi:hypothetical protein